MGIPVQVRFAWNPIRRVVMLALVSTLFCAYAIQDLRAQTYDLTVVVLVNSSNATGYNTDPANPGEYQRYPERYLEHLQIPYRVVDVSSTAPQDLSSTQLIVAAHRGLNLSAAWQQAIMNAVAAGTGFVNLDSDPGIGTNAHIQAIFGATGSVAGSQPGYAIDIPSSVMPDGATPHFIAAMQIRFPWTPAGDIVYSFHNDDAGDHFGATATILQGAHGTVVAKLDTGDPLILATTYQSGRAVHFGSYDYMRPDRFGFMMGVDDLFWRSLVWAARKPFVVRGYPRFFALQMDDLDGGFMDRIPDLYNPSFTGNILPDGTGGPWKPTGNFGMNDILQDTRSQYIPAVQAGLIELSPHAIRLENAGADFYWNLTVPNTDAQWLTNVNSMLAWKTGQGGTDTIPSFSRSMVPHYGDLSNNAGYDMWNSLGLRYVTTMQSPGTYYFATCKAGAQRMMLRPFRIYELPPSGCNPDEVYPIYYADDLTVGSRAGLPSQTFFAFATWPPLSEVWPQFSGWTVAQSLQSFEHDTWRFWSGLAPFDAYTHDLGNYESSPVAGRQALITQLSAWLTSNGVRYVFMEQLGDYFYARAKSTLVSGVATPGSISLTFTGNSTDPDGNPVQTKALVFNGDNEGTWVDIPSFTNGTTVQVGNVQLVSLAVTPANPSIAEGTTQPFTATGTYSDNSTQNLTSFVTWTSATTSVATITSAGVATGVGTGTSTIQATSGSISGSTVLTVTPPALVSIAVIPANASVQVGSTPAQYTATGTYSDTSTQNLTSSVTWVSTTTSVATITSAGVVTPVAAGSTTIQATSGSIIGSTGLTVTTALVSIAVTPANPSIAKGRTQAFTATGTYSDNSTQNLTSSVTWASATTSVATITSAGVATGVGTGTSTIQATSGSISGSTVLTVTPPALVSIAVTPANSSMAVGATPVQYTATGTYSDNSTQNLTSSVTWVSTTTSVATITSAGVVTPVAAGSTTIQATSGSIIGSTGLTVTSSGSGGLPSGLVARWTFNEGSGTTAADSSGNGYNATLFNGVTWVAGKLNGAISANGANQYVSTPAINLSATSAVTIAAWVNRTYSTAGGHVLIEASSNYNSSTTGFGLFPDDATCGGIQVAVHGNSGYSVNCFAQPSSGVWHHLVAVYDKTQAGTAETSLYIDGVLQTPTKNLNTTANTNAFGSNPIYLFSRGGTQEFNAGLMDDLQIYNRHLTAAEVQQIYTGSVPTLVSIAVTPANPSIAKGRTQAFTATGTYSDNSTQNLTSSVTWTSATTSVATITSAGVATGVGTGTSTIQATSGSISGSTVLTVTPPALVSIAVTPANASVQVGSTPAQYTATGTYSDNSTQNLTSSVTWVSTTTSVATITSAGVVTPVAAGSTTIQATSGSITGSTGLTVTIALVSIAVTPANPSIAKGRTQAFTATGTYSDNSTQNLTSSATWTSATTSVATITSAGVATGVGTGTSTIQATSGSISGSTVLTVTPPALVSIAVTPANASVQVGSTPAQYTATGTYSDNSTQNLTSSVTWVSTTTSVATITSAGVVTPVAAGSTTIQATSGSITGSTGLTVTTALVSIAVTPANPSIAKGKTQAFTATGTYSDNSTQNLTSSATWTSAITSVATITSAGVATGVGTGTSTIQATSGSISGSTVLTVTPPALVSIAVTPANASVQVGSTPAQYTATGTYSDNSTQNLTSSVTWASTTTSVATITSAGVVTPVAAGSTTIQATSGSIIGSTGLTVTSSGSGGLPSGLVGYWTFNEGSGTTAADSSGNGYTATLVNGVTWTTGKVGGAISANGVNQYVNIPAVNLSATSAVTIAAWVNRTYSTAGGHVLLEATTNYNSSTTGFGLFPDDATCGGIQVAVHGNSGYSVNCFAQPSSGAWHHLVIVYDKTQAGTAETSLYIDGVLQTPTKNLNTTANTNAFGSNPIYLYSRGGTQEFNAGTISDLQIYNRHLTAAEVQQIYSVGGPPLVSIAVTPANPSIAKGTTQPFTATGTYSDNSKQNLTSSATWTSATTSVATITSAGVATGVGTGTSTIQATSGSISGSTVLTVTPTVLVSIAVTPANSSMTVGATPVQYTATGTYSDNSTQNLTSSVTWVSTTTTVATISSAGVVTPVAVGSTTIKATSGSITGSTGLTVTTTGGGGGTGAVVQAESGDSGSATNSITYFAKNATNGDLVLVFSHWDGAGVTATVTDNSGGANTYIALGPPVNIGSNNWIQAWYAKNVVGTPSGFTATYSAKTTTISLVDVVEYSGFDKAAPLDAGTYRTNTGTGTAMTSGASGTTIFVPETMIGLFGAAGYGGYPFTLGSGYKQELIDATSLIEDMNVTATGSYTATGTSSNSISWGAIIVGLK